MIRWGGLAAALAVGIQLLIVGYHKIPEGHVGVYYVAGRLSTTITAPGYHIMVPYITKLVQVSTSFRTATVPRVECGSSGGVVVYFGNVEVVYRLQQAHILEVVREYSPDFQTVLIVDRVRAVTNAVCAKFSLQEIYIEKFDVLDDTLLHTLAEEVKKWTRGIEIITLRLTKPLMPESIRLNYETMETTRVRIGLVTAQQENELKQVETAKKSAVIAAQADLEVERINMARKVAAASGERELSRIENGLLQEAEVMKRMLTPEFMQLHRAQSVLKNTKMFLGDRIPASMMEEPESRQLLSVYESDGHVITDKLRK